MEHALPVRPAGHFGFEGVNGFPIELTATSVNINLIGSKPSAPLPEISDEPKSDDEENSEPALKEVVCASDSITSRRLERRVELKVENVSMCFVKVKIDGLTHCCDEDQNT